VSTRVERERVSDLMDETGQGADFSSPGQGPFVGITTSGGSYPTVAQACYMVAGAELDGGQAEGDVPTVNAVYATRPCINLGSKIPPVGTPVLVKPGGGRLVFRYG
jgi:hypothetical protein